MKNIARLLIIMFVAVVPLAAQGLDVTKKPEPIDKKEFVFPEYNSVMLENGMRAYFIKDDEQPTFVMRVLIPGGSSIEGEKTGLADITTGLMTKGAAGMSAFEIARKLDGVGASLSVSAGGDYVQIVVSCLKKHVPLVLETMNDVLTKPEFPQDEFDKLVKQMIAGIQYEKSEPGAVSTKLAKKTIYGEDHPYAQHATEKSIKSITIDDVKDYYNKYIVPNYATVAVIGDIDPADIKPEIEKALAGWNKGKDYEIEIPKANPMPKGVYFISRPASVQSVVSYNTAGVGFAHPDYETLDMAASVIGAGFAGRLFRTLREKYSYTYTPFGYLTSSKYTNRFSCGADVRNSVTDSALNVIFNQINDLAQNGPADDELMRVKNYTIGSYLMNFESSEFIASLVQDADFYGIPIGKVKNYPDRAGKITAREIRKAAAKYLSPADARYVVIVAPELAEKLEKIGPVFYYNLDLERTAAAGKLEKVSLDSDDLIEKYVDAIGGEDAIDAINTIIETGSAELNVGGQVLPGQYTAKSKAGGYSYILMDLGMTKSEIWVNSDNVWVRAGQNIQPQEGPDRDEQLFEAQMFYETKLLEGGYKCEVLGKNDDYIIMKCVSPEDKEKTYFYDAKTYLLRKVESMDEGPQGPVQVSIEMDEYKKFGGVMLPTVRKNINPMFTLVTRTSYEINKEIDSKIFEPTE